MYVRNGVVCVCVCGVCVCVCVCGGGGDSMSVNSRHFVSFVRCVETLSIKFGALFKKRFLS